MKATRVIGIGFTALCFTALVACKKDSASPAAAPATVELQTSSDDQTMASNENDIISSDVTAALTLNNSFSRVYADGNPATDASMRTDGDSTTICDAVVTSDTTSSTKLLTITYNGGGCVSTHRRTGTVVISEPKGMHWKDAGAVVTISIKNLTITRVPDGKSVVINGQKVMTNTSGGLLTELANHEPITHDFRDSLTAAFDKGTVRTWNIAKHRVFVYDNGIKMTTTGTHSDGTHSDIAEWGTNRYGVSFISRITVPKVISQACGFRLVKGQDTFSRSDSFTAVVTYGLDANGLAVAGCPAGNFYAQAAWTYIPSAKTGTFLFQY